MHGCSPWMKLVSERLHDERLSKKAALGVLSSDCISSSAYGSEEMLIVLLPIFGLAGFHILMPLTLVVLGLLVLTTLSYRQVVMIYTRAGGSYVVARENFGPRVAQIASVALLIDYIVTVAVQSAAGTAAITSLAPGLRGATMEITVAAVLLLAYGNLRGVREAGKAFAFPTYFFATAAGLVVVVGVARELVGDLPKISYTAKEQSELIAVSDHHHAVFSAFAIYVLLKAFANGGASLTGLEAISNGVSAFKPPEGVNARRTLTVMSMILGTLVLGISFLAWQTHATPYSSGSPTVISQVAQAAFGTDWYGHSGFVIVQVATALILFTGANTPFTGFPFLASFIAEDSFLPRQMTRRGHRLAFSNGIVVLTAFALALLLGVGAHVDKLIPFYAIGVFTGFTMAGLGMAKYHYTKRQSGWRAKLAINLTSGLVSAAVVAIFAVVKFTEGAWLVVLLFPIGWLMLTRLNRRYRSEARSLEIASQLPQHRADAPHYSRHTVLVLVDRLDLAVLRALRYAGSLRPTEIRVIHVRLDPKVARALEQEWIARNLGDRFPLTVIQCSDRRLIRTISELALDTAINDRAEVTVLLPRRTYHGLTQRLLHDRTADRIAMAVGRIPHVAATIVPFDTTLSDEALDRIEARQHEAASERALDPFALGEVHVDAGGRRRRQGATQRHGADRRHRLESEGHRGRPHHERPDRHYRRTLTRGAGLRRDRAESGCSSSAAREFPASNQAPSLRAAGRVGEYQGHLALANPRYELITVPAD